MRSFSCFLFNVSTEKEIYFKHVKHNSTFLRWITIFKFQTFSNLRNIGTDRDLTTYSLIYKTLKYEVDFKYTNKHE